MSTSPVLPPSSLALSIVIPCYNEQNGLAELHRRTSAAAQTVVGTAYELILVNDGSTDQSWPAMLALAARDSHIVAVNLARNHGHQLALSAGLGLCRGRRVLVLDADLQDPPELLGAMMVKMDEGHDVVFGQREERQGETMFKRATASLFYRLLERLSSVAIPRDTGDFRLMSRRVVEYLVAMPEQYRFVRGMVSWIGFRQCALPYVRDARLTGETHYPLRKMLRLAIDAATSFSIVPLRFASLLGCLVGLAGLGALGLTLLSWLYGDTVRGWASLAAIVLIPSSIQLFMLGVFGEYLGRMYMESKRRPLYIIDEVRFGTTAENPVHELQGRADAVLSA
jgi:polyisoprenyl-phosphate glycosyltransferase